MKMKFNYFLGIGIVLSLVGTSLLVAFGFLYVKPYINVMNFKQAACTTVSTLYTGHEVTCQCASDAGSACVSRYPCLQIKVMFIRTEESDGYNVTMYDSYETYTLQSETLQCSYHKCSRSQSENANAVARFAESIVSDETSYPCFYNPDQADFILLYIISTATCINCILWPSIALVLGLVFFFLQICRTVDPTSNNHWNQFSSLERQWARIREQRTYGHVASERLVKSEAQVDDVGHTAPTLNAV